MSRLRVVFIVGVFFSIIPGSIQAQETDNSTSLDPAVERKALELLESVAERIPNLNAPGNRILLTCSVADLLWPRNEKRARVLFENLTSEMAAVIGAVDLSDGDQRNTFVWIHQQRQQILERMAQHDPELALTFIRVTRFPSLDSIPSGVADNETNLELVLAAKIAAKNPEMALRLARAALAQGLSHNVLGILSQLQQKDPAAAQKFYRELVDRILDDGDLLRNQQTASLAWSLLSSFQPPHADEQTYREFLDSLMRRSLSIATTDHLHYQLAQNLYHQMRGAMPLIQKHSPARAPAFQQWLQNLERTFDPVRRMHFELNEIYPKATAQEILALASKYPEEMRPQIYQQAVWKALHGSEPDAARRMATEFLSGNNQQHMLSQIEQHLVRRAIDENKVAAAQRLLSTFRAGARLPVLMQLAGNLTQKGDMEGALAFLNEAKGLLASLPENSATFETQLQLARGYFALDVDQSITILRGVIARVNELVAAAAVLNGFENRYLRDGEWLAHGPNTLSHFLNNMEQILGHLATLDIDRATRLSDQLERNEIRLKTQLTIVQSVLRGTHRNLPPIRGRRLVLN